MKLSTIRIEEHADKDEELIFVHANKENDMLLNAEHDGDYNESDFPDNEDYDGVLRTLKQHPSPPL
eukprot:815835-Prorocentrum_lima.AAC.1